MKMLNIYPTYMSFQNNLDTENAVSWTNHALEICLWKRKKRRGAPLPHHHNHIPDVCGWEHRALLAVVDLADTRVPSLHCPALICAPTCNPTSCFLRGSKISFVSHIVVILLPEVLVIWSGGQQSGDTLHSTEVGGQNPTNLWQKYFL